MRFSSDDLTETQIQEREDEMLLDDVLGERLLERWLRGQVSDHGLLERLSAIKAINADYVTTHLVDELNRNADGAA